jgi:hypothetical protein
MPKLGIDLAIHLGIELGIDLAGVAVVPPVVEPPALLTGLKAWFDSRDTAYFALGGGGEVSAWLSRGGSLGAIAWSQGTAANQPIRVPSEPLMNNMPAVLFDGVNDSIITNNQNAWTFLHDGTGHSVFRVYRMDSTGAASQTISATAGSTSTVGARMQSGGVGSFSYPIYNGTAAVNLTAFGAHSARDVARWHMLGHVTGTAYSRTSISSLSGADVGGQLPSVANPTSPYRLGAVVPAGTLPFKGLVVQDIYYDHVLSAGELATLTAWAAPLYGVAA